MIDPTHRFRSCAGQLPEVSRLSVYYEPQPTSGADFARMRRIDELHLEHLNCEGSNWS